MFELLKGIGRIPVNDYRRVFNLGIGMVFAVSAAKLARAKQALDRLGEKYFEIGRVVAPPRGFKARVIYT